MSILELTAIHIKQKGLEEVLLLGTKFTMEDDFFKGFLLKKGIKVVVPSTQEMDEIQEIQTELAAGKMEEDFKSYFKELSERYDFCDGLVLGCTELPLVFDFIETKALKINPIELQCSSAVDFILS
ncbi:MAG: aspartate/glutamate racemase family protein [Fulvivirga sp.]